MADWDNKAMKGSDIQSMLTQVYTDMKKKADVVKKQSADLSDWDDLTDTGIYEIGGQPSGVLHSPESNRMTLIVIKSVTVSEGSGNGRYFVAQLAIGNSVYRRSKNYRSATDSYEWSDWDNLSDTVNGYKIVVGQVGNDPNTIYIF